MTSGARSWRKFLALARAFKEEAQAVMFGNEGVRLACEGSAILDDLHAPGGSGRDDPLLRHLSR